MPPEQQIQNVPIQSQPVIPEVVASPPNKKLPVMFKIIIVFLIVVGVLMLIGFFFGKDKSGMSFKDRRTVSQLEGILDKTKVNTDVASMVVGEPSDVHGVKLINTVIVKNKEHGVIAPFLQSSGKFGYASGKFLGAKDLFFYDGIEVPIKGSVSDFKEISGKLAYLMYDPSKKVDDKEVDRRTLIYDGKEMPSLGFVDKDFKEVGGNLMYVTYDKATNKQALMYDGKELISADGTNWRLKDFTDEGDFYNKNKNRNFPKEIYFYDGRQSVVVYDGGKVTTGLLSDFKDIKSGLIREGGHLAYNGLVVASGTFWDFKDIGGKVAYSIYDSKTNSKSIFYDGKEIATGTLYLDYENIGGKLAYKDNGGKLIYDGKETSYTGVIQGLREIGGRLAYAQAEKDQKSGIFVYDGKEFPFEGNFNGLNTVGVAGEVFVFTVSRLAGTMGFLYDFYYNGIKIGTAGRISQFVQKDNSSPIYFYTEDKNKESTIFSIYEIR